MMELESVYIHKLQSTLLFNIAFMSSLQYIIIAMLTAAYRTIVHVCTLRRIDLWHPDAHAALETEEMDT